MFKFIEVAQINSVDYGAIVCIGAVMQRCTAFWHGSSFRSNQRVWGGGNRSGRMPDLETATTRSLCSNLGARAYVDLMSATGLREW